MPPNCPDSPKCHQVPQRLKWIRGPNSEPSAQQKIHTAAQNKARKTLVSGLAQKITLESYAQNARSVQELPQHSEIPISSFAPHKSPRQITHKPNEQKFSQNSKRKRLRSLCGIPLYMEHSAGPREKGFNRSPGGVIEVDGHMYGLTVAHGLRKSQSHSASAPKIKDQDRSAVTLGTKEEEGEPIFISFQESTWGSLHQDNSEATEKSEAPTTIIAGASNTSRAKSVNFMPEIEAVVIGFSGAIGRASIVWYNLHKESKADML